MSDSSMRSSLQELDPFGERLEFGLRSLLKHDFRRPAVEQAPVPFQVVGRVVQVIDGNALQHADGPPPDLVRRPIADLQLPAPATDVDATLRHRGFAAIDALVRVTGDKEAVLGRLVAGLRRDRRDQFQRLGPQVLRLVDHDGPIRQQGRLLPEDLARVTIGVVRLRPALLVEIGVNQRRTWPPAKPSANHHDGELSPPMMKGACCEAIARLLPHPFHGNSLGWQQNCRFSGDWIGIQSGPHPCAQYPCLFKDLRR